MKFYSRNGRLYIAISKDGKRLRKATGLEDTPKNRKLVENSLKKDILLDTFGMKQKHVSQIGKCLDDLIANKINSLKTTSFRTYSSICNSRVTPYFADKLVTQVKPIDIKKWQDELVKDGLSNSTLNIARVILSEVFDNAVLEELIISNPVSAIKMPKNKSEFEINPLKLDEIKLLLENSNGMFHNYIAIACFSGLRSGELLGLRWDDIDFKKMTISVNRTITSGFIQSPKTISSKRKIEMLDICKKYLLKQQLLTGMKNEYVFLNKDDSYIKSSSHLHSVWKQLLKSCNLEYRSIYQTRHTFASMMLNNNEDLLWVSSMLGHTNASITLNKYSKYISNKSVKRAEFLNEWHINDTVAV